MASLSWVSVSVCSETEQMRCLPWGKALFRLFSVGRDRRGGHNLDHLQNLHRPPPNTPPPYYSFTPTLGMWPPRDLGQPISLVSPSSLSSFPSLLLSRGPHLVNDATIRPLIAGKPQSAPSLPSFFSCPSPYLMSINLCESFLFHNSGRSCSPPHGSILDQPCYSSLNY